jgi:hypothetical protein
MTRIVLDSETLTKLHGLQDTLELCDEDGRCLGIAVPLKGEDLFVSTVDEIQPTSEEIQHLRKQPAGRPLKEILADLEQSV